MLEVAKELEEDVPLVESVVTNKVTREADDETARSGGERVTRWEGQLHSGGEKGSNLSTGGSYGGRGGHKGSWCCRVRKGKWGKFVQDKTVDEVMEQKDAACSSGGARRG